MDQKACGHIEEVAILEDMPEDGRDGSSAFLLRSCELLVVPLVREQAEFLQSPSAGSFDLLNLCPGFSVRFDRLHNLRYIGPYEPALGNFTTNGVAQYRVRYDICDQGAETHILEIFSW